MECTAKVKVFPTLNVAVCMVQVDSIPVLSTPRSAPCWSFGELLEKLKRRQSSYSELKRRTAETRNMSTYSFHGIDPSLSILVEPVCRFL